MKNQATFRANFEAGLYRLFARWGEARFCEAYLLYENDMAAACEALDPTLVSDLIRFRQWHVDLIEGRDRLPSPSAEDLAFDRSLADAFDRFAAGEPLAGASDITVATWRGKNGLFMRVGIPGRPAYGHRLDAFPGDGDAVTY
jgi:hypothetical protein